MATLPELPELPKHDPPATGAVGKEIQKLRVARGLSLRRLAERAHVSAATLSRWEAEKRTPRIPELEAALDALEASASQKQALLHQIDARRALIRLRDLDGGGTPGAEVYTNSNGELLWAMRQRKGWSQAQTARAANTTQAQIARWERGEAWPEAAVLHSLCWCLDALPEEVAALSRRGGDGNRAGLLLPHEPVQNWDEGQWAEHVAHVYRLAPAQSLVDLTLIGVEQHLGRLAASHDFAIARLADVYALHARHSLHYKQRTRALHWAERGLALQRRQRLSDKAPDGSRPLWFGNVIVLATYASQNKKRAGLQRAAKLLHDWLPALHNESENRNATAKESADAHYAWGQSEMAKVMHQLGGADEAATLAQAACRAGEQIRPSEGFLRWRDFARLLLDANQPAQALDALTRSETIIPMETLKPDALTRHHLMNAECYLGLSDLPSANERVRAAERIIADNGLWYLQSDLRGVAAVL